MATCDVTFKLQDITGTALENVRIRARYETPQSADNDTVVGVDRWVSTTTDANGDATLSLEQHARARITCVDCGIDTVLEVPGQATYVFARHLADWGM